MTAPEPLGQLVREAAVRVAVVVERRVGDPDPAVRVAYLRVDEPRHEVRDRPLDRDLVVGLHVRRRSPLARRTLGEPLLEVVDRGRHQHRHVGEAESAPDRPGGLVADHDVQRDRRRIGRASVRDALAQQRLRDTVPARRGPDVHEVDVHRAVVRPVDLRDTKRGAVVVLGEEDAACIDLPARVAPLLLPALRGEPGRLRHLALELLPELAERRLVGGRRGADVHGVRAPASR